MAEFDVIGVEAVIKGVSRFISSMERVNRAYEKNRALQQRLIDISNNAAKAADAASKRRIAAEQRQERSIRQRMAAERNEVAAKTAASNAIRNVTQATDRHADAVIKEFRVLRQSKATYDQKLRAQRAVSNALNSLYAAQLRQQRAESGIVDAANRVTDARVAELNATRNLSDAYVDEIEAQDRATAAREEAISALSTGIDIFTKLGGIVSTLGAVVSVATFAWDGFVKVLKVVGNVIQGTIKLIGKLLSPLLNVIKAMGTFISRTLSVAVGMTIFDTFRGIVNRIVGDTQEFIETLSLFQRVVIQLNAVLARDLARTLDITVAQAMRYAGIQAKELLQWVRDIAVTTPFTVRAITDMLGKFTAFGVPAGFAKEATTATLNWVAAMGLTEEHSERIIYNLGQMLALGKASGREFRDLATSLFPVEQIITEMAKEAGVARAEMRDMLTSGQIPVAEFIQKFILISQRDFPNAMAKMARTWEGVQNNIKDFVQVVLGAEILGPTFDRITARAANALDKLLTPSVRNAARVIGRDLLAAVQIITGELEASFFPAVLDVAKAFGLVAPSVNSFRGLMVNLVSSIRLGIRYISQLVRTIGTSLADKFNVVRANAETWGYNIIASLANGMAQAATIVIKVLNFIAGIITSLFKAKSPPKILPDLTKWGAAAIRAYLDGWRLADFTVFKEISDTIGSYLQSIPGLGDDSDRMIARMIARMRVNLAAAINDIRRTGDIGPGVFDTIFSGTKGLLPTKDFKAFITALFNVEKAAFAVARAEDAMAEATKRVEAAQKAVSEITDRYSKILDDLNNQLTEVTEVFDENARLQDINAAIATGLLTTEELARLEAEKRAIEIRQQIRAVEGQRDAELERADAILKAAEAQQETIKLELEAAQARQALAQESLDTSRALIEALIEQNNLFKSMEEAISGAAGALDSAFDEVDPFAGLQDKFEITLGDIIDQIENPTGINFALLRQRKLMEEQVDETMASLESKFSGLQGIFEDAFAPILGGKKLVGGAKGGMFVEDTPSMLDELIGKFNDFSTGIAPLSSSISFSVGIISSSLSILNGEIERFNEAFGTNFASGLEEGDSPAAKLTRMFAEAIAILISSIAFILSVLTNFKTRWDNLWIGFKTSPIAIVILIVASIIEAFTNLRRDLVGESIIPDMLSDIYDAFETWMGDIIQGAWDWMGEIYTNIDTKLDEIKTTWEEKWQAAKDWVVSIWNDPDGIVQKVLGAAEDLAGIFGKDGTLWTALSDFKTMVLDKIALGFDAVWTAVDNLIGIIGEVITLLLSSKFAQALAKLASFLPGSPPPLATGFMDVGKAISKFAMQDLPRLQASLFATPMMTAPGVNTYNTSNVTNHYSTQLEFAPTYQGAYKPERTYYDVSAALSAVRR